MSGDHPHDEDRTVSRDTGEALVRCLARAVRPAGFDLVQPLRASWYNHAIAAEYRLPDVGDPGALAVLFGNTRALWPVFCDAVAAEPGLAGEPDPLDRYSERVISAAVARCARSWPWEIRFAHEQPPRRVAMQQLAHVAGLAYLGPSHLSVHPTYGPWIALRAVAVIAVPGPQGPPPALPRSCDCREHCLPHFARALAMAGAGSVDEAGMQAHWRDWVAVRDACPVGREYRYDDDQIRYHYCKDKSVLREE